MDALLVHGGERTAEITKDRHPVLGAKTARNLLAPFHHPEIRFGLVVGKGDGNIGQETQDAVLLLLETQQTMETIPLFDGPSLARALGRRRIGGQPSQDEVARALPRALLIWLGEQMGARRPSVFPQEKDASQEDVPVACPILGEMFVEKGAFAYRMGDAERMGARRTERQSQGVVNTDSLIPWQDPHRIGGLAAALGVRQRQGIPRGTGQM
jgi:hypothetical protein